MGREPCAAGGGLGENGQKLFAKSVVMVILCVRNAYFLTQEGLSELIGDTTQERMR